jgi:hypothetical protein
MSEMDHTIGAKLAAGAPVIVNLHTPREKIWGVLYELNAAGVFVRGIDLNTFDEWIQVIVRGERNIGLNHVFLPMWRVERILLDETLDDIPSMADRFFQRVGITVYEYLGI